MQVEAGHKHELPDANTDQNKQKGHGKDPKPLEIGFRTICPKAVISDILSKIDPIDLGGITQTAGPIAGLKPFKPKGFVESESLEIAPDKSFPEDSARKLAEVSGFDVEQLPDGQLCRSAHSFERDTSLLALRSQLVTKLNDTFRSFAARKELTQPAPIV